MNVNRSFLDAANKEKLREREALEAGLMFSRDRLMEIIPVRTTGEAELREGRSGRGGGARLRLSHDILSEISVCATFTITCYMYSTVHW